MTIMNKTLSFFIIKIEKLTSLTLLIYIDFIIFFFQLIPKKKTMEKKIIIIIMEMLIFFSIQFDSFQLNK